MSDQVALLRGRTIVQCLKDMLVQAEAGELTGVVVVYETTDHKIGHSLACRDGVSMSALVGELHLAMITLHVEDGRLRTPGGG